MGDPRRDPDGGRRRGQPSAVAAQSAARVSRAAAAAPDTSPPRTQTQCGSWRIGDDAEVRVSGRERASHLRQRYRWAAGRVWRCTAATVEVEIRRGDGREEKTEPIPREDWGEDLRRVSRQARPAPPSPAAAATDVALPPRAASPPRCWSHIYCKVLRC